MRAWPDLTEYHEAVQHPPKAFADPGLKAVTLELDRFGMPKPATGGNAVVYKGNEPGGLLTFKKTWAIRCFLRPDRKSTRLNSSHSQISYAVFCLKKKKKKTTALHAARCLSLD